MSTEDNKHLVRRFFEEGWNKQDLALVDALLSADYVDHNLPPGLPPTREGFKQSASMYWRAFPDGRLTIEEQVAEGDTVVTRWSGRATHTGEFMQIAPTGKQVAVDGITINRVTGGKFVESWLQFDRLGLLQQLGVVPAPG
jgi:predicted ester cyclase